MSNYVARFAKTLLSFIPFGGNGDDGDCNNCEHCRPKKVECKSALKRKCMEDEITNKDDSSKVPEKKVALDLSTETDNEKVEVKEEGNKVAISDVKQGLVQNLNELTKLIATLVKDEGITQKVEEEKKDTEIVQVESPAANENPAKNPTTSGETNAGDPSKEKVETSTVTPEPNSTAKTDNAKDESKPSVEDSSKKVEDGSTTTPKDDKPAPPATPATTDPVPDPKAEKERLEEEAFVKEHEVIISQPDSSEADQLSFSSPLLNHHNLEKQIDFLIDNIITPMKYKEVFTSSGLVTPKGMYFYGPGVPSSSLVLAKALAFELSKEMGKPVRLFRKMDTDIFSKYSEEGSKFASKLFAMAVKFKPSIVLIQDIDAVCNYCDSDILTNKELVKRFGEEIDKIVAGEVLVIFTLKDLKRSFPPLKKASRFQKYLEFPFINSVKSIASILKQSTAKWDNPDTCPEQGKENDKILDQLAEKILKTTPAMDPDDVAQLCQDVYQKCIQIYLKTLPKTKKNCACKCCLFKSDTTFPTLPQWEEALEVIAALKKAAQPVDRYAYLRPTEVKVDAEKESETLSFSQVGGLAKQIEILKENIVVPLRNKAKLKELGWGVEPVRGFIFHGPPGTGKTLLGKALAAELSRLEDEKKFSFIYHKGTECHGMYVGQTEGKLREIFENAKKNKPSIIFLDEIDGLCSARNESGNSRFYNGVVTTILGLMDNIPRGEVFVIAATNRLAALDPALRRPGRFDKCIEFQAPKLEGRKNILEIHTNSWKEESKLKPQFLEELADKTGGYTGADLEQLCRQAFVFSMRRHTTNKDVAGVEEKSIAEKDGGLDNLLILEEDWHNALRVVKSSGTNYFGNAVISDKPLPKLAMMALQSKIEDVTTKLGYFLKVEESLGQTSCGNSGLNCFLIWGSGVKQQKVIDNLFIPSLLSSKPFSGTVAVKLDLSMTLTEMASALHNVINPGEDKMGILYIPNVDQLLDPRLFFIEGGCELRAAQRKFLDQLEVLRGERVLVLGTGRKTPIKMGPEIQALFKDVENARRYELQGPTAEEIRLIFEDFATKISETAFKQMIKMLASENASEVANKKDVSVYDLMDFKSEMDNVLKRCEGEGGITKEEMEVEIEKVITTFGKYLEGQEKFKTSLRGMYT